MKRNEMKETGKQLGKIRRAGRGRAGGGGRIEYLRFDRVPLDINVTESNTLLITKLKEIMRGAQTFQRTRRSH